MQPAHGSNRLAFAACSSPGGRVSVLQGDVAITPGAALAWRPLQPNEMQNGDARIDNDIMRQRIRAATENALTARGYQFVQDPNAAQFLVSYHIGLQDRQDIRVDPAPGRSAVCGWRGCVSGFGWGMYGPPANVRTVNYVEGTLMLDLTDRASGQLAWRATSQQRVNEAAGRQDRLDAALVAMTSSLP